MSASITARSPLLVVLYEGAGAMPLDADARFEITRTLLEKGYRDHHHARRAQRHDAGRAAGARARPLHRRAAGGSRRRHRRRGPLPRARRRRAGGRRRARRRRRRRRADAEAGRLEAVVPGHRLQPLHQLHAVPVVLPVRRLRRVEGQADRGAEARPTARPTARPARASARKWRSSSRSTRPARSTATRSTPPTSSARR